MEGCKLSENKSLDRREAVVTGGCRGLGRAITEKLSAAGAHVTILDLESVIAETDIPDFWRAEAVDYAADEFEERIAEIARSFGKLDVLVANAGVVPPWRGVAELDFGEWERCSG